MEQVKEPVSMKEVVEKRVAMEIERGKNMALKAWELIVSEAVDRVDYLLDIGTAGKAFFVNQNEDRLKIVLHRKDGSEIGEMDMHHNAWEQLGARWSIPSGYLLQMATGSQWRREYIKNLLNGYAANHDTQKVLIRTVNGLVKAVLSDRYRRMDSSSVFAEFVHQARNGGMEFCGGHVNDMNCNLTVIRPKVEQIDIGEGVEPLHIAFGSRISTSDYGRGSLELHGYFLQGACLNGMVIENKLRSVHLGARITDEDIISMETVKRYTELAKSMVKDTSTYLFSEQFRRKTIDRIRLAAGMEVDMSSEVEKLVNYGLTKDECEQVSSIIMGGRYEDGMAVPASVWKCSQAISAIGRDDDPRSMELQTIAGQYFDKRVKLK